MVGWWFFRWTKQSTSFENKWASISKKTSRWISINNWKLRKLYRWFSIRTVTMEPDDFIIFLCWLEKNASFQRKQKYSIRRCFLNQFCQTFLSPKNWFLLEKRFYRLVEDSRCVCDKNIRSKLEDFIEIDRLELLKNKSLPQSKTSKRHMKLGSLIRLIYRIKFVKLKRTNVLSFSWLLSLSQHWTNRQFHFWFDEKIENSHFSCSDD